MPPTPAADPGVAARFLRPWALRRAYHRARLEGAERIPATGGAVIVSNHGRLDFDFFVLIGLILHVRGRLPRLMADHLWYELPLFPGLLARGGAVDGTREAALELVRRGELVLTYPGGVREIMGSRFGREHIDWAGRTGFARVAVDAGVPVVPITGIGVNSGHIFLTRGRLLGRLLYRHILRLGALYDGYRDPLALGLLPVPLPYSVAVHLPLPCRVRYVAGEPVWPAPSGAGDDGATAERELADRSAAAMRELIERYGRRV